MMRQDLAAFLTVLPHKTLVQYVRAELRKRTGVPRKLTHSLPCYWHSVTGPCCSSLCFRNLAIGFELLNLVNPPNNGCSDVSSRQRDRCGKWGHPIKRGETSVYFLHVKVADTSSPTRSLSLEAADGIRMWKNLLTLVVGMCGNVRCR